VKDIKYLIIPDVHGRAFWEKPVEETLLSPDGHIVFLGDYLDPYSREWESEDITPMEAKVLCRTEALERFKKILELKKQNPDRVTLLLGNHDCGYAVGEHICSDRMDRHNCREIEHLFRDNRELFQLAEECDIAGRHFVFSHAGILKGWVDLVWGGEMDSPGFNVVNELNDAWLTENYGILDSLRNYDLYRGWRGGKFGSPVWSDIRSWTKVTPEETYGFNIVGHTQQKNSPVILGTIADLDCRKAFYLDGAGKIVDYY